MDLIVLALAKKYTNSVALNGVPVQHPQINSITRNWEIFSPTLNAYVDTGVRAEGVTPSIGLNSNWFLGDVDTGVRAEGRNIELNRSATHMQWRVVGDAAWNNLIALEDLRGERVQLRVAGDELQWRYESDVIWQSLFDFTDIDVSASMLPFEVGAPYEIGNTFFNPDTGFIYVVLANHTSTTIEDALEEDYIMRIGGGGGIDNPADLISEDANNALTTGSDGNLFIPKGEFPNRFTSTGSPVGNVGTLADELDLNEVTPINIGDELAIGDTVIFANGNQGEVTAIDETEETFDVVIIFTQIATGVADVTLDGDSVVNNNGVAVLETPTADIIEFESQLPPRDTTDPDLTQPDPLTSENVEAALDELTERNQDAQNNIAAVNAQLVETNRVLSGKVTRTASGFRLDPVPFAMNTIPLTAFPVLDPPIVFITGATIIKGSNTSGTLAVFISYVDNGINEPTHLNAMTITGANQILVPRSEFPPVGDDEFLYVDIDTDTMWRWDYDEEEYVQIGSEGTITDVLVNGESIVTDGIASIDNVVTSPNENVATINYTEDENDLMEHGELRWVNDPLASDPNASNNMALIPAPHTGRVVVAQTNGQVIESALELANIATTPQVTQAIQQALEAIHIEQVLVDSRYENGYIIFTREDGSEFDVPIVAIVSGLVNVNDFNTVIGNLQQGVDGVNQELQNTNIALGQTDIALSGLNDSLTETNQWIQDQLPMTLVAPYLLNTEILDYRTFTQDASSYPIARLVGGKIVSDADGTWGVVIAADATTGAFTVMTKGVSGGDVMQLLKDPVTGMVATVNSAGQVIESDLDIDDIATKEFVEGFETDVNNIFVTGDFANRELIMSSPNTLSFSWTADRSGFVFRRIQVTHPTGNYLAYSANKNGEQRYIQTWQGQTTGGTPQNTGLEFWVDEGDTVDFIIDGTTASTVTTNELWYMPIKEVADISSLIEEAPLDGDLYARSNAQWIGNTSLKSDGFLLRLTIPGLNQSLSMTPWSILQGRNLQAIATLSANIDLSEFSIGSAGQLIFPAYNGYLAYEIDVRYTGTGSVAGNNSAELVTSLFRQNAQNVAVSRSSLVTAASPDLSQKSTSIQTYTLNTSDPFIDGGVQIRAQCGTAATVSQIDIIIKGVKH